MDYSTIKITSKKVSRNTVDISKKEITSEKVRGSKVDFSTFEIKLKKVRGNNGDFSTIEITSKKSMWKQRGFFDQRNHIEKVCGDDLEIRRIDVDLTWSARWEVIGFR